jgi:hypothetical protein
VIRRVTLSVHQDERETFCCKSRETLRDRARRSFLRADWADDGEGAWCAPREDGRVADDGEGAWCAPWDDRRVAAGGGLTDEMGIALLCGSCFDTRQGASTA